MVIRGKWQQQHSRNATQLPLPPSSDFLDATDNLHWPVGEIGSNKTAERMFDCYLHRRVPSSSMTLSNYMFQQGQTAATTQPHGHGICTVDELPAPLLHCFPYTLASEGTHQQQHSCNDMLLSSKSYIALNTVANLHCPEEVNGRNNTDAMLSDFHHL